MLYLANYNYDKFYHVSTMEKDEKGFITILSLETGEIKKVKSCYVTLDNNSFIDCNIELRKNSIHHRTLNFTNLNNAIISMFTIIYVLNEYDEIYLNLVNDDDSLEIIYTFTKTIIEMLINS